MPKSSPDDHNEAIRHLVNNKPEDDFCGLTPNEMHRLIYEPYTPESPLKINPAIPDRVLDQLPFFRLTEEFVKLILRDGSIKLTPLGATPKKVLVEGENYKYLQIIYPDTNGHFPKESGYDYDQEIMGEFK